MDTHPYGWLSLLPSLVAIGLAITTRRIVPSMLFGIVAGALITSHGDLVQAMRDTFELHLFQSLVDRNRLQVFAFTLLMGAMVGVIERSGGMTGLVQVVSRWAHNRQRGQLATWLLGMLVFFDDYANTVLLGSTLQPLCRQLRISREKLAYLVDSTAAPVAGLAVISTWVAGEIDFVQNGIDTLDRSDSSVSAFSLFIASIPYRFYVIWSLVFVFLVGFMQRDFGPMLRAEQKCVSEGDDPNRVASRESEIRASGWWNAVAPIVVTIAIVLYVLYRTGSQAMSSGSSSVDVSLWQVFGNADSYFALLVGSISGLLCAVVMARTQRLLVWIEIVRAAAKGARVMVPALAVLWLASALSTMTGHSTVVSRATSETSGPFPAQTYRLYTGEYVAGMLSADVGSAQPVDLARWMPTIIFVLSSIVSFATGTSWGTMAIVMPIAIPLAYGAIANQPEVEWHTHPVLLSTIGSVLAGSIFGDHCSPISDTTILSSQACGCEHSAHVWTQLPYALVVGLVSIVVGTLPIGFGLPVWGLLPIGVVALVGILLLIGRRVA